MKTTKQIIAFVLGWVALFFNSQMIADDCCQQDCCLAPSTCGSIYTGLGMDFTGMHAHDMSSSDWFDPSSDLFPGPIETVRIKNKSLGYAQPFGTFFLGYETRYWCRFNLALEAFISAAPKHQSESDTADTNLPLLGLNNISEDWNDLYMNTLFGVALMPGYQIYPDVSVYCRVGYCAARAQLHDKSNAAGTVNLGGMTAPLDTFHESRQKYLKGFQTGLGFKMRASEHIQIRFGYNWTNYDSLALSIRTEDPSTGQFILRGDKRHPQQESFCTSILYYFTPPEPFCPNCQTFCGHEFYAGICVNRDNSFIREQYHQANARPPQFHDTVNFNNGLSKTDLASKGWGYEALIGYGYTLPCGAYIGLEAFYNNIPSKFKSSDVHNEPPDVASSTAGLTDSSTELVKLKDCYGVNFNPGYKLNDHILLYLKLGGAKRRLQYKTTEVATPPLQPRDVVVSNRNDTKDIYGYQLGAGFDLKLCENLFLRNEYVITQFSIMKLPRRTTPALSHAGFFVAQDRSFSVMSGVYKLGLVYKFPIN